MPCVCVCHDRYLGGAAPHYPRDCGCKEEGPVFINWKNSKASGPTESWNAQDEARFPISNVPGWFTEEDLYEDLEGSIQSEEAPDSTDINGEIEWEVLEGSAEHNWEEIAEIAFLQAQRGYPSINWLHLLRELKEQDTSCCKYSSMEEREEAKSKEIQ